jgi:hypothetical protein
MQMSTRTTLRHEAFEVGDLAFRKSLLRSGFTLPKPKTH